MRTAFICDTPVQIINCINYVINQSNLNSADLDIFIGQQFQGCDEATQKIKSSGIFKNTYRFECKKYNSLFSRYADKIKETFFSASSLSSYCFGEFNPSTVSYNRIYMSFYTCFSEAFRLYYSKADVVFFEDGFGTYSGKVLPENYGKRKAFMSIIGKDFPSLEPTVFLVNNIDAFNGKNMIVEQLPSLKDKRTRNILNHIFNQVDCSDRQKERIIFLVQPNDSGMRKIDVLSNKIYTLLNESEIECLLRPHPRMHNSFANYENIRVDENTDIWELSCDNQVTDDTILIGMYSSAQIMPKILYGTEPKLIFLYNLYSDIYSREDLAAISSAVKMITGLYHDKNKICVPEDFTEFQRIICKIKESVYGKKQQ